MPKRDSIVFLHIVTERLDGWNRAVAVTYADADSELHPGSGRRGILLSGASRVSKLYRYCRIHHCEPSLGVQSWNSQIQCDKEQHLSIINAILTGITEIEDSKDQL